MSNDGTRIPEQVEQAGLGWALKGKDRQLGWRTRTLSVPDHPASRPNRSGRQDREGDRVQAPGTGWRGDKVQGASVEARAVEMLSLPFIPGERLHLWALTPSGHPLACVRHACWGPPSTIVWRCSTQLCGAGPSSRVPTATSSLDLVSYLEST